ncbi:MAG: hypothetical protein GY749_21045 [Desulfobacteraceae bacterium]|nr:hypothetical protein [Desulfobacteraceae bacterium]
MNLFAYDITIAYSDEKDVADIAMLLRKGLQKEGMRIRLFDVSTGSCLEAMQFVFQTLQIHITGQHFNIQVCKYMC